MSLRALVFTLMIVPVLATAAAERVCRPDLAVEAVTVSAASPSPGDAVTFRATVRNVGDLLAPASLIRFELDGVPFATVPVDALARDDVTVAETGSWTATPGTHSVTARLVRSVTDASRINDAAFASFDVAAGPLRVLAENPFAQVTPFSSAVHVFTITNVGHDSEQVDLARSGSGSGWAASLDRETFTLDAGETVAVHLTVVARPGGAPLMVLVHAVPRDHAEAAATVALTTRLAA